MKQEYLAVFFAASIAISGGLSAQEDIIPVVPANVMSANVPEPIAPNEAEPESAPDSAPEDAMVTENGNQGESNGVLKMAPGVNQIIPIAIGHPNRIVTPFSEPAVTSTSIQGGSAGECSEICIRENVIYIATDKEYPVTMFITESGSESRALSLTMVPRRIPPREVFLELEGQSQLGYAGGSNAKAEAWEESQPYIETIRSVFRSIALGQIPQGYTMNAIAGGMTVPGCAQSGLSVDFTSGQVLMGHNLTVYVGVATNVSDRNLEFMGQACGNWDVAASTSWPETLLEPGQMTEIFVAVKKSRGTAPSSTRPSLIGGGQ